MEPVARLEFEVGIEQIFRGGAGEDGVGIGPVEQVKGDIRDGAFRCVSGFREDGAGMDREADVQSEAVLGVKEGAALARLAEHFEGHPAGPAGVVVGNGRITEVDNEVIGEGTGDVAAVADRQIGQLVELVPLNGVDEFELEFLVFAQVEQ